MHNAPEKNNVLWSHFCGQRFTGGRNSQKTFSTIWRQCTIKKKTVYEWTEKFKTGRTSVKHAKGGGRSSTSTSEEKTVQVQQMILANRRITIDEIMQSLQIRFGSAQKIIHEILGYNKFSARSVPKKLTEEHKRRRMEICQTLPNRYSNEGEKFLSRIVTGDESWVHY